MARIVQQGVITTSGTSYENEPIIKSDGPGDLMEWESSDGTAEISIQQDLAGDMAIKLDGSALVWQGKDAIGSNIAIGQNTLDAVAESSGGGGKKIFPLTVILSSSVP